MSDATPRRELGAEHAVAALAALSEGVVVQLASGEIVSCNPAAERILGLSRDELAGRTSIDPRWRAVHEDGSPFPGETHPAMVTLRTGEALRGVVMGVHTPGGSLRWISVNSEPIPGEAGRPASVVATFVDVTERRNAEAARRAVEDEHRFVFENSPAGMSMTRPSGEVRVNETFARWLGYEKREIEALGWQGVTHPEDVEETRRRMAALLSGEQVMARFTKRFLRKDGAAVWADVSSSVRCDAAGRPLYFVTNVVDVTERMRTAAALAESEEKYRRIVETTQEGVWQIDAESRTSFVNRQMAEMLGYSPEEMVGQPLFAFMTDEARAEAERNLERRRQGIAEGHGFCFRRKDGSEIWTRLSANPLPLRDGAYGGALALVTDITERRKAEEALRESEAKFRLLAENSTDVIGILGTDGVIRYASPSCRSLTGYGQEELVGRRASDLQLHADRPAVRKAMARHAAGAPVVRVRYRIGRPDGPLIWVERITRAIRDSGTGEIAEFQFSVRDVTETKKAEDEVVRHRDRLEELVEERTASLLEAYTALQEEMAASLRTTKELRYSEERLRLAQEVGRSGTYEWDFRTEEVFWSSELQRLFGLFDIEKPREVASSRKYIHPDDLSQVDEMVRKAVEERTGFLGEYRIVRPDGEVRWMEGAGRVFCDDAGEPWRLIGVNRDVTDRRRSEDALLRSQERFELVARGASAGIWDWDVTTGEVYYSDRCCQVIGCSREELEPTFASFERHVHPGDRDRLRSELSRHLEQGEQFDSEFRVIERDGGTRWVRSRGQAIWDEQGRPLRLAGSLTDITGKKESEEDDRRLNAMLEQKVRERTTELEAANRELEAFSASVSHDLRTPLWAISELSRTFAEDFGPLLGAEGQRRLDVVRAGAERLLQLVDDLLAFARVGRAEIRHGRIGMRDLVRSAFEEVLADPAARDGVDFEVGDLPDARGDASLVRLVWVNLLSNAVKFSVSGKRSKIRVEGRLADGEVLYSVRDNGTGFETADAGKLFGVFRRLHSETEFPGNGIGLSLVRRIVERHGGRVRAEGAVGEGATFSFTLGPAPTVPETGAAPVRAGERGGAGGGAAGEG